jgi:hypothetical protein
MTGMQAAVNQPGPGGAESTRADRVAAAATRLALDAATVEMVDALAASGIRAILLKGAAIAARLYDAPAQRHYADFDLLVDPRRFDEAGRVVQQLGYTSGLANARERWYFHAIPCQRGPLTLDLHHRLWFAGADPDAAWAALSADTVGLELAGRQVEVLSDPALALLLAAHVVHHGGTPRTQRDLHQAVMLFDRSVWAGARDLADRLELTEVLAAGLRQLAEGQALAQELSLPSTTTTDISVRLAGEASLSRAFVRLSQARSPAAAVRLLAEELVPSPAFMRYTWPAARRGRAALLQAYVVRAFGLARDAPDAFAHWSAARRGASRRGASGRGRRRVELADLRAAVWTWRAGTRVRRQLRSGGLDAVSLPRVPSVDVRAARGVRAIMARRPLSCLERSLVRQRWHAAHGDQRELVVGVTGPGDEFGAHAWLQGDPDWEAEGFAELLRRPAQ